MVQNLRPVSLKQIVASALLFTLFGGNGNAQQLLSGTVIDLKSGAVLPYVNVGVMNKGLGTVTDESGKFTLRVPEANTADTLKISSIGYAPVMLQVKNFSARFPAGKIALDHAAVELRQVIVKPKKVKQVILGHKTTSKMTSAGFTSNLLGSEMGVPLNIKKGKATWLKEVRINVVSNKYDTVLFRVNIYTLKNGLPDKNILDHNLMMVSTQKSGLLTMDLKPLNIVVDEDVVVCLEWLKDLGDTSGLYFSAGLINGGTIFRHGSQGKWEKSPGVGVGLHVVAEQ